MRSPTRRLVLVVGVSLLVVFAGCNAGPPSTSTATTTDAGGPSDTGPTTVLPAQLPPGVAANGTLTNVSALVDAHYAAMADEPMTLTVQGTNPNGSSVVRYAHGANGTPTSVVDDRTTDGRRVVTAFYRDGWHAFTRAVAPDRRTRRVAQNTTVGGAPVPTDGGQVRGTLWLTLVTGTYHVDGTVDRDGRTLVRLTATEVSPKGRSLGTTAYEGTALVTSDGVVYDVTTAFDQHVDGKTGHFERSVTLDTDPGWTGPPPWVADLPHLSLSTVAGGHALELRNTGGAALPANVSFAVCGGAATDGFNLCLRNRTATVTTTAPLAPGHAVYVVGAADGNASSVSLHAEPVRGGYVFENASVAARHGNVSYTLATYCAPYSPCRSVYDH